MSSEHHEAELKELESALRELAPPSTLDREALMYQAGRASVRQGWAWPAAAALSSMAALALAALLWMRPAPEPVVRFVPVPTPGPQAPVRPDPPRSPAPPLTSAEQPGPVAALAEPPAWPGSAEVVRLREHLLHWGLDGLPPDQPAAMSAADTPASLLRGQ